MELECTKIVSKVTQNNRFASSLGPPALVVLRDPPPGKDGPHDFSEPCFNSFSRAAPRQPKLVTGAQKWPKVNPKGM